jgi:hypothetical protein
MLEQAARKWYDGRHSRGLDLLMGFVYLKKGPAAKIIGKEFER